MTMPNILSTAAYTKQFLTLSILFSLFRHFALDFGMAARYDSDDVLHIEKSQNYIV